MKSIVLFVLTLNLTGCFTGLLTPKTWFNQDEYLHFLYKDRQEGYISSNVIPICKYRHCKKMSEDAIYVEYYYNFIAFRSRYKGTCTTGSDTLQSPLRLSPKAVYAMKNKK
jgi:hypothetical protein